MADDEASKPPQKTSESVVERMSNLADYSRSRLQSGAVDLSARVKEFKPKDALDAVLEAPDRFKREWQKKWSDWRHHAISSHYCDCVFDDDSLFRHSIRLPR